MVLRRLRVQGLANPVVEFVIVDRRDEGSDPLVVVARYMEPAQHHGADRFVAKGFLSLLVANYLLKCAVRLTDVVQEPGERD
ncbi:MAG TPA: hypothetical protein PLS93_11775 [Accumulibacter sp.]|nr:hypothetical protein [Accumulibacter sp.]